MTHLSKLKLVAQGQRRSESKTEHRRTKVIEKLEEQLSMAEALIKGDTFRKFKTVWRTNDEGERVQFDRQKRVRPWYWMNASGCFISVWYGSKIIKLDGDNTAISVGKREQLPEAILDLIEAVRSGELDRGLEDIAERGIPEIKLKGPAKALKVAS
jgi:hypothetical protein